MLVSSSHWPTGHFWDRVLFVQTWDEMQQGMPFAISQTNPAFLIALENTDNIFMLARKRVTANEACSETQISRET